jgi:hypothetical protein
MQINTGSILIDPRTATGAPIAGAKATLLLYNHRLRSLDAAYHVKLTGKPILLAEVPAFPFGSADLVINIDRYNSKKRFVNVQPDDSIELTETFLLDAKQAKPKFPAKSHPAFAKLAIPSTQLTDLQKAGLLNVYAKAQTLDIVNQIESILEVRPARLFAKVNDNFLDLIRDSSDTFQEASGISHTFPKPWRRIETRGSFKTKERQANLQLTFATNSDNQLLIDMDIADNQGLSHAFDVIGHALTGADTHPYNIHQVLVALQGIDPGYTLS